ncbi:MAG TPA: ABC transporter ATP-binding protein [Gemmataceae bacterium]|jgi:putative ABC transport system ATP-binding protein
MVRMEAVSKVYRRGSHKIVALIPCTLKIEEGEFLAVTGHSGSGKSTLLAILGGMLAPTTGRVWINGQSLYALSVTERTRLRRRMIGFVFQAFNLVPYLSALENVQVPLYLAGLSPARQRRRATELLQAVGLGDRMSHRPSELSAGQQQRVALARTLANDPPLILADEPTGNLDPDTREQVLRLLESFRQSGKTVVMVTHDPAAAERASRVLRLTNGLVLAPAA